VQARGGDQDRHRHPAEVDQLPFGVRAGQALLRVEGVRDEPGDQPGEEPADTGDAQLHAEGEGERAVEHDEGARRGGDGDDSREGGAAFGDERVDHEQPGDAGERGEEDRRVEERGPAGAGGQHRRAGRDGQVRGQVEAVRVSPTQVAIGARQFSSTYTQRVAALNGSTTYAVAAVDASTR